MAGIFGAITRIRFFAGKSSVHISTSPPSPSFNPVHCKSTRLHHRRTRLLAMAHQDPQVKDFEILEPSPKIPKLGQNGVAPNLAAVPFLRVKKLSEKAVLPSRASPLSAGYDLSSAAEVKVPARGKALVPTDLSIAVPEGTYARIAPRSGLAWKHSIDVGAGVIDADYRGPVGVILFNYSDADFEVKVGDRIAQLIIEVIMTPEVSEVDDLDTTVRGAGGFGSTGV
ncbi:dUTP diphosphatase [Bertholletia excelsa]